MHGCVSAFGTTVCYDRIGRSPANGCATDGAGVCHAHSSSHQDSTATSEPATSTATPTQIPTSTATAQPVDPTTLSLDLEQIADGLNSPVFATHAGDGSGRLFVVEKKGEIRVLDADGLLKQPFLDIRKRVGSGSSEQGLLGLAFHPNFGQNGRLFVYYTDKKGNTVISRFQANAERTEADPDSEVVLLTAEQPASNHNGGMLAFGPDGMLYAGLGDGGGANDEYGNGQKLSTLLGKILRIDVDSGETYAVPADNPFAGQERRAAGNVGLRLAQSMALLIRPPNRRPVDRRRRPGRLGGSQLPAGRQPRRRELRLVDHGGHALL